MLQVWPNVSFARTAILKDTYVYLLNGQMDQYV